MITAMLTGIDSGETVAIQILPIKSELKRRVSRVATLDGGAVIIDGGLSDSDRSFLLECADSDIELQAELETFARIDGEIRLSIAEGVFAGKIESVRASGSKIELMFMVRTKL